MSTFAVFGMTRDVALAEAKKRTKCTRKNVKARGLFPLRNGWNSSRRKPSRLWGCTDRQLSPLVDAPQFIELARKTLRCRDLRIKAKAELVVAKNKPIINPKTKAPKVGF